MAEIWAISTNKGGVLKTSIATNLAGLLSVQFRTLIIDADNQGNVALSFGINPDELDTTLYDVLVESKDAAKAILNVHRTVFGRIDILPSNDDMVFFEFDVLTEGEKYKNPFSLLKNAIQTFSEQYDYILIDTPPNLGLTQGNVLSASDQVLIPFQPESYSMRSLVKILSAIDNFKRKHNPSLKVMGVVATLVDQRTTLHAQVLQEARQFCEDSGVRMFDTMLPRSIRSAASVAYERKPITLTTKNNQLVAAYHELLREVGIGG